ncbi:hypothetical protein VIGAN_07126000, partial [Vigna angularis var. angularis]
CLSFQNPIFSIFSTVPIMSRFPSSPLWLSFPNNIFSFATPLHLLHYNSLIPNPNFAFTASSFCILHLLKMHLTLVLSSPLVHLAFCIFRKRIKGEKTSFRS